MGYWENRQAQMMYEYMEDAEKVSQEIADIYAKASTHLSLKIDRIYEKFRDKNNLTDRDAIKLLNTLKDRTDIGELKKALKKSQNTALLAEMESGAYRARIERLENLQAEIDRMMQQVFEQEKKVSTSHYVDLATNSYYREIYNVQRQVGFQFSFSAVDPEAVNMLLKSKWSGLNYSERIWKNTQNLAKDVKEQMIIGLLTGKRQEEMAREIAFRYATGAFEARRLVRTESNFVNGQMQMAAYEECGAEKYEFVATLDLRTSAQCRELDGQVFLVKDAMPGKNMNPMHPFCRSTTIIHMGDEVIAGLQRRARNPITGENELVPADLNYHEWYKNNIDQGNKFGIIKLNNYEGIPKNWKKIGILDDSLRAVNPHYSMGQEYRTNCTNCVSAYEMRKRGYDVIAKPRGKNHYLEYHPESAWKDAQIFTTFGSGKTDILKEFEKWPEGARAEIAVVWKVSGGHVFVAEKTNGVVHFYDVQSGEEYAENVFEKVRDGETKFWRIDNIEPSDRGITACEVGG